MCIVWYFPSSNGFPEVCRDARGLEAGHIGSKIERVRADRSQTSRCAIFDRIRAIAGDLVARSFNCRGEPALGVLDLHNAKRAQQSFIDQASGMADHRIACIRVRYGKYFPDAPLNPY